MPERYRLEVYRRLDNRLLGEPDDSPLALELHERRRHALESVFGSSDEIRVVDWGDTKDSKPHELVELVLVAGSAALKYAVVPGLRLLGEKLIELGTDRAASEVVKAIVSRIWPKQEAKEVNDIAITLPNGTRVAVQPPDGPGTITVSAADGSHVTIDYTRDTQ